MYFHPFSRHGVKKYLTNRLAYTYIPTVMHCHLNVSTVISSKLSD